MQQQRTNYLLFKSKQIIGQARILSLQTEMTTHEVKIEIFKQVRPLLRAPDISAKLQGKSADEFSSDEILRMEYDYFFENEADPIYKVQIFNNLRQTESGMFFNSRPACEFCGHDHKDNCDFSFENSSITLDNIIDMRKPTQRTSLILSVCWRANL